MLRVDLHNSVEMGKLSEAGQWDWTGLSLGTRSSAGDETGVSSTLLTRLHGDWPPQCLAQLSRTRGQHAVAKRWL